jgi:hypothetical protein
MLSTDDLTATELSDIRSELETAVRRAARGGYKNSLRITHLLRLRNKVTQLALAHMREPRKD